MIHKNSNRFGILIEVIKDLVRRLFNIARLWQSGFELNTTSANVEWTSVALAGSTVQTGTVRSGTYAGEVTSFSSGARQGFLYQFASAAANGPYFFRVYVNFSTLPSAENRFINLGNGTTISGASEGNITIDNLGALRLYYNNGGTNTVIGSPSSALNTNNWYCIEVWFDRSLASGSQVVKARIDQGTEFASATNLTINAGIQSFVVGSNLFSEAQTTGNWFFDDIAINDSTGTHQTSYPGAGQIVHLKPNANGDKVQFATGVGGSGTAPTGNFSRVNEVTPNDATSYNQDNTNGDLDHFTLDATPVSIGSSDTINVVQVGIRVGSNSNINQYPDFATQIESQANGTLTSVTTTGGTQNGFSTNTTSTPKNPALTSYTDPQSGGAWTKALLDTAQAGYKTVTSHGSGVLRVSTLWVSVDSTPLGFTFQQLIPSGQEVPRENFDKIDIVDY